jgi:hypothetical protein
VVQPASARSRQHARAAACRVETRERVGMRRKALSCLRAEPAGSAPDLDCEGRITGNTAQGRCVATVGNPVERFTGTLKTSDPSSTPRFE